MTITLHQNDIPADLTFGDAVAVDTEAMGLNNHRDRLCLVQISAGDGTAHLVQFQAGAGYDAPNLKKVLEDPAVTKIFQYARFDIALIKKYMGVECNPLYCTKIASFLARTYTDRHGLRNLCQELLGVELKKQQQSSDWGAADLTQDQLLYAANDVLYLHELRAKLDDILTREGRQDVLQKCFDFLPTRADLDLGGWVDMDIFSH